MRWTNGLVGTLITSTQVTGDWVSRNLRETRRVERRSLTLLGTYCVPGILISLLCGPHRQAVKQVPF